MNNQIQTASEVKNSSRTSTLAYETRKNRQGLMITLLMAVFFSLVACGSSENKIPNGTYVWFNIDGNVFTYIFSKNNYTELLYSNGNTTERGKGTYEIVRRDDGSYRIIFTKNDAKTWNASFSRVEDKLRIDGCLYVKQ